MIRRTIALGVLLGLLAAGAAWAQSGADEKLFTEAKILLFDKKWSRAEALLEDLLDRHPESAFAPQALFYKAKAMSEQPGKERGALEGFEAYLGLPGANAGLAEEADASIVDLAFGLSEAGDRSALRKVESRLEHAERSVRYYAAYKLSQSSDKSAARKAVPVLREIVESERDAELRDRARIALLRVSPEALRSVEDRPAPAGIRMLKIRVYKRNAAEPDLSLNIPWALADLAIQAIPEEEKAAIRRKGYDLNKILGDLARSRESILEIRDEDSVIKIWIE